MPGSTKVATSISSCVQIRAGLVIDVLHWAYAHSTTSIRSTLVQVVDHSWTHCREVVRLCPVRRAITVAIHRYFHPPHPHVRIPRNPTTRPHDGETIRSSFSLQHHQKKIINGNTLLLLDRHLRALSGPRSSLDLSSVQCLIICLSFYTRSRFTTQSINK